MLFFLFDVQSCVLFYYVLVDLDDECSLNAFSLEAKHVVNDIRLATTHERLEVHLYNEFEIAPADAT